MIQYAKAIPPKLNIRAESNSAATIVAQASRGEELIVLGRGEPGWLMVGYAGGVAYVAERYTLRWWAGCWPTDFQRVTQSFGNNPDYYGQFGFPDGHEGIDIAAPLNSPIYTVAEGVVYLVTDKRRDGQPSGYGWHVRIRHTNGYTSLYAHLSPDYLAVEGVDVEAGTIIGYSGNSGNSTGPHLHLTIRDATGRYLDPATYLQFFRYTEA